MAPKSKIPTALPRSPNTSPPKQLPAHDKSRPATEIMPGRFADFFKEMEKEKSTKAPASPRLKVEDDDHIARTTSRSPSPTKTYLTKFHTTPVQQDPEVPDPDVTGSWSMLSELHPTSLESKPSPPSSPAFLQDPVTGAFAVEVQEHGVPADVATPEVANNIAEADSPASPTSQDSKLAVEVQEHGAPADVATPEIANDITEAHSTISAIPQESKLAEVTPESPKPSPVFSSTSQDSTSGDDATKDEDGGSPASHAETFSPIKFAGTSSPAVKIFSGYGDKIPQRNFTLPFNDTGSTASSQSSPAPTPEHEDSEGEIDAEKMTAEITDYFWNHSQSSDDEESEERLPSPRKLDQEEEDSMVGDMSEKAESSTSSSDEGVTLPTPVDAFWSSSISFHDDSVLLEQGENNVQVAATNANAPPDSGAWNDEPILSKLRQGEVSEAVGLAIRQAADVAGISLKKVQEEDEVQEEGEVHQEEDNEIDMTPDTELDWGGALKAISPVRLPAREVDMRDVALSDDKFADLVPDKVFKFGAATGSSSAYVDRDDYVKGSAREVKVASSESVEDSEPSSPDTKSTDNEASTPSYVASLASITDNKSISSNLPELRITAKDLPKDLSKPIGPPTGSAQMLVPVGTGSDDGIAEHVNRSSTRLFEAGNGLNMLAPSTESACLEIGPSAGALFGEAIAEGRSLFGGVPTKTQSPRDRLFSLISYPCNYMMTLQGVLQNPSLTLEDLQVAFLCAWSLLQGVSRQYGNLQAGEDVTLFAPISLSESAAAMPFYDILKVSADLCKLAILELVETRTALELKMAREINAMLETRLVEQRAEPVVKSRKAKIVGDPGLKGDAIFTICMLVFLAALYGVIRDA